MASSQNPYDRKDNSESTSTSNITPGEPLWNKREHIQKSFGQGYDWSDPVSFLKGNTTNEGGYESGNAIDRFGTFSLREQRYDYSHGSIVEVIIDRTGGDVGEFEFYMKMDTEPTPGRPDPNTGIIGPFQTSVEHGFYTCKVDLDMYSLNKDVDGISYDFNTNTMYIVFRNKETQKRLRFLVPYRTQVAAMNAIELKHDFTYKIDEYELLDVRNMDPTPEITLIDSSADCQPGRVVPLTTVVNNKAAYKVYTLPIPQPFTEAQGANPPEIDTFNNSLFHRLDTKSTKYTVGKTRSVEGAAWSSGDLAAAIAAGNETASGCLSSKLSATGADPQDPADYYNLYWSCVFNKLSGEDKELILYDQIDVMSKPDLWDPERELTPLSAFEYGVRRVTGMDDVYGNRFTGYESHEFTVGQDPNLEDIFKLHENDPNGASDFVPLPAPDDYVSTDGDQTTTYGNVKYTMFTGLGVDPASLPHVTWYMTNPDASHLESTRFPARLGTTLIQTYSGSALSAFGGAWNVGNSTDSSIGTALINQWVVNDNSGYRNTGDGQGGTSNVLYTLSGLTTDIDNYQLNQNNLRGYYMTCDDHQSKELYLIFDSSLADPPMEIRNNRCKFSITKLAPYDVDKHARYDELVFPSRKMKHGLGTSRSYKLHQSWTDGLSGDNLMYRLFTPLAPLVTTTTPAFTGYTDFGAISADDMLFLSFVQGTIPGDPSSIDPEPELVGPELNVINPANDDDASGVGINNTYSTYVTYQNIGDAPMWMDFQYLGETKSGDYGSWSLSLSTTDGGTTATQLNNNNFKIDVDQQVTVIYQTTITQPQIDAGEDHFAHTYLLDTGSKPPGVSFPTETINITI